MSTIIICMPDGLEQIKIEEMPKGLTPLKLVAKSGGWSVALGADGTLYSMQQRHQCRIMEWTHMDEGLLTVLGLLKILPRGFKTRTQTEQKRLATVRAARMHVRDLRMAAQQLGLKVPASMERQLEKKKGGR